MWSFEMIGLSKEKVFEVENDFKVNKTEVVNVGTSREPPSDTKT